MTFIHSGYLNFTLPDNWCAEYDLDNLLIYNPSGEGAITMSFYNLLTTEKSVGEQISILAKKFIDQSGVSLNESGNFIEKNGKSVWHATGTTKDGSYTRIWVIGKYPRIVLATYFSEQKNEEVRMCDTIIDNIQFKDDSGTRGQ